MESRLKALIDKVDVFKEEDEYMPEGLSSLETCKVMNIFLEDEKIHQIAEYKKQSLFLENRLALLRKDLESQTMEKESLLKRIDELTKARDVIDNQMGKKIADVKSELSYNRESSTSESPVMLRISHLLNLITNLDWNLKCCDNSKINGHLVSRSILKPFSFNLNVHKPYDVQENLWDMIPDGGLSQILGT